MIIFAYEIVKCSSGKTFRAILRIFYQYRPRFHTETRRAQLIKENLDSFEIISLTSDDYKAVINLMVTLNLRGGAIYDALIAYGSLKAEVDHLLTLNLKHFIRFGGRIEKISMEPR